MATPPEVKTIARESFFRGVGLAGGITVAVIGLLLFGLGLVYAHDFYVENDYARGPRLGEDNRWGPLLVSVQQAKRDVTAPESEHQGLSFLNCEERWWAVGPCMGTIPAEPGGVAAEGKVYVKSRYWLKTAQVPRELLTIGYAGRGYSPNIQETPFGTFLKPRSGASASYTWSGPYEAREFHYSLHDGNKEARLVSE